MTLLIFAINTKKKDQDIDVRKSIQDIEFIEDAFTEVYTRKNELNGDKHN